MPDIKTPADHFKDMAERIERNPANEFAGAYVILSPKGIVVSQAFINPDGDEASFWGFVSAMVQTNASEAIQSEEQRMRVLRGGMR